MSERELTEDDIDSLTNAELDEMRADDERHDAEIERDLFTPGSIDSIPWPTAISVRPREVRITKKEIS